MQDRSYWRLIRDPGFSWMLASQFLGAFNVNVYTWAITFYALDLASRPDAPFEGATMVGIIGATFIIPYLRRPLLETVGADRGQELRDRRDGQRRGGVLAGRPAGDAGGGVLHGHPGGALQPGRTRRSRSHETSATAQWCGGVSYTRVPPVRASGSSTRPACR